MIALSILRTTPGEIVRCESGTVMRTPDGCRYLEWRPSVLIRSKPAFFSRLTMSLVFSAFVTKVSLVDRRSLVQRLAKKDRMSGNENNV